MLSLFSRVRLFETPWTVAHQAPLSMGFSMQEYWSGLPCPPPGDLPNPGIEPTSLMSPALAGEFFITSATCEAPIASTVYKHDVAVLTLLFYSTLLRTQQARYQEPHFTDKETDEVAVCA